MRLHFKGSSRKLPYYIFTIRNIAFAPEQCIFVRGGVWGIGVNWRIILWMSSTDHHWRDQKQNPFRRFFVRAGSDAKKEQVCIKIRSNKRNECRKKTSWKWVLIEDTIWLFVTCTCRPLGNIPERCCIKGMIEYWISCLYFRQILQRKWKPSHGAWDPTFRWFEIQCF